MNKYKRKRTLTGVGVLSVAAVIVMTSLVVTHYQSKNKITGQFSEDSIQLVKEILHSEITSENRNEPLLSRNRIDYMDAIYEIETKASHASRHQAQPTSYLDISIQENFKDNPHEKNSLSSILHSDAINKKSDILAIVKRSLGIKKVNITAVCIANDVAQAVRDVNEYCNLIDYTPYLTQFMTPDLYKEVHPDTVYQTIFDFPKLYDEFTVFYNTTMKQAKEHSKSWRSYGGVYVAIDNAFHAAKKCASIFYVRSEGVRNIMKKLNTRQTDAMSFLSSLFEGKNDALSQILFKHATEKVSNKTNEDQQEVLIGYLMDIKEEVAEVLSKSQNASDELEEFRDNLLIDRGRFEEVSEKVLSLKESYSEENKDLRESLLKSIKKLREDIAQLEIKTFETDVIDKKLENIENEFAQLSLQNSKALRVKRFFVTVARIIEAVIAVGSLIAGIIMEAQQREAEQLIMEENIKMQSLGAEYYGTYLIIETMEKKHLILEAVSENMVVMNRTISKAIVGVESMTNKFQSINTHLDRTIDNAKKIKNNAERENFHEDTVSSMEAEWGKAYARLLSFESYVKNSTISSCNPEDDNPDNLTTPSNSTDLYLNQTTPLPAGDLNNTISNNTVDLSDSNSTETNKTFDINSIWVDYNDY